MKRTTHQCGQCEKYFIEPIRGSSIDAWWIGSVHFCSITCCDFYRWKLTWVIEKEGILKTGPVA